MAVHQIEQPDDYCALSCSENPAEVDALFRDLLIGVTNFFRDPEAFKVLRGAGDPAPARRASRRTTPMRVWVCGCSTGEEAYSIAILLHEHMLALKQLSSCRCSPPTSISHGDRAGPHRRLSRQHRRRRLARSGWRASSSHDPQRGTYRIHKHIRDLLVFSEQDVIKDPPFSKLDLISCRNLLIYLNADLQRKLIPLFHYALVPGGVLFLGTSETVGENARPVQRGRSQVEAVHAAARRARRHPPGAAGAHVPPLSAVADRSPGEPAPEPAADAGQPAQLTERALLSHYAQAGVLVNDRGEMLHILGRTGQYLEPAAGEATMNVLTMARDGLRRELTVALHKCGGAPGGGELPRPARQGQRRLHPCQPDGAAGADRKRGAVAVPRRARRACATRIPNEAAAPASTDANAPHRRAGARPAAPRTNTCRPRSRRWRPPTRS